MKKTILGSCLALLMSLLLLTTSVFAAEAAKLSLSSASGKPGDEITLTVSLTENPGIAGLNFIVDFDVSVLELKDLRMTEAFREAADLSAATVSTKSVTFASMDNYTGNGDIVTMRFAIKADAAAGNYAVSLNVTSIRNSDEAIVPLRQPAVGMVTVAVAPTPTPTPVPPTPTPHTHTWGEWTVTVSPTCTEQGERTRKCSVCGEIERQEVKPLGHETEHIAVKTPTYEADGNIEYWYCSTCGKFFRDNNCTQEITREQTILARLTPTPTPEDPGLTADAAAILRSVVGSGDPHGYTAADVARILAKAKG